MPSTLPSPRNNPHPPAQNLEDVELLTAFHKCFKGDDSEVYYVDFKVEHRGADTLRTTRITRNGQVERESDATAIRRA